MMFCEALVKNFQTYINNLPTHSTTDTYTVSNPEFIRRMATPVLFARFVSIRGSNHLFPNKLASSPKIDLFWIRMHLIPLPSFGPLADNILGNPGSENC